MNEISPVILRIVEIINELGYYAKIIDTEMTTNYPHWGVNVEVSLFDHPSVPKHRLFLKHQIAEDMLIWGRNVTESFLFDIIKEDYNSLVRLYRKQKLEQINKNAEN